MILYDIISAQQSAYPTVLDLIIDAEIRGVRDHYPFSYDPLDDDGLTPEIENFFFDHPDFPISPYVPPVPSTDPADYRLTKRQICAALIIGGVATDPDGWMLTLLDHIEDDTTRALAINDWKNAPYYDRSNALFSDAGLVAAAGMTSGQIDALWMTAKDLPA